MVLLADHHQSSRVGGSEAPGALERLAGQREIQIARGGRAQLKPEIEDAGVALGQIAIDRQSAGGATRQQLSLRLLPALKIARGLFQSGQVRMQIRSHRTVPSRAGAWPVNAKIFPTCSRRTRIRARRWDRKKPASS